MMAYRSSVRESTGETPNMLMLGRKIEVPLDVILVYSVSKHLKVHNENRVTIIETLNP